MKMWVGVLLGGILSLNILSAAVNTSKDRTAISKFTFEMADATHLDSVLAAVRAVEGVYDVYRN